MKGIDYFREGLTKLNQAWSMFLDPELVYGGLTDLWRAWRDHEQRIASLERKLLSDDGVTLSSPFEQ